MADSLGPSAPEPGQFRAHEDTNDHPVEKPQVWLLPSSQNLATAAPTFRNWARLLGATTSARADWRARDREAVAGRLGSSVAAVADLVALLPDLEHVGFIGRRLSEDPGPRQKATGSPDLSNRGDKAIRDFIANVEMELRRLSAICESLARRVAGHHPATPPRAVLRTANAVDTMTDAWLAAAHGLLDAGPGPDTSLRGSLLGAYAVDERGRRRVLESSGTELSRLNDAQRRRREAVRRDLGEWEPVPDKELLKSLRRSR